VLFFNVIIVAWMQVRSNHPGSNISWINIATSYSRQ
jgi:hypothetical protein